MAVIVNWYAKGWDWEGEADYSGLHIVLKSDENEYLPTSTVNGIRVTVHHADEDPFPEHNGVSIGVGREASIHVTHVAQSSTHHRLQERES